MCGGEKGGGEGGRCRKGEQRGGGEEGGKEEGEGALGEEKTAHYVPNCTCTSPDQCMLFNDNIWVNLPKG